MPGDGYKKKPKPDSKHGPTKVPKPPSPTLRWGPNRVPAPSLPELIWGPTQVPGIGPDIVWGPTQVGNGTSGIVKGSSPSPSFWDRYWGTYNNITNPNVLPAQNNKQTPVNPVQLPDLGGAAAQAGVLSGLVNKPPVASTPNPLSDLDLIYKQLLENINQGAQQGLSDKQIRKLAEDQVKMTFDPQIQALKQDQKERQMRYEKNKAEVLDLYNDLKTQYSGIGNGAGEYYGNAIDQQNQQRQSTDQEMNQNYQNSLDYMTDEFGQLGIGDVAQNIYPQQQRDLQYQQTLNNTEQDAFNRYLSANQAADQSYYSKMAANAGLHGAESVEDLLDELNTYLDNSNANISTLRSQRTTSLSDLILQMQQQRLEAQQKAQQEQWSRLLQAGNFGVDLQQLALSQQKASQSGATGGPTTGLLGAADQLANTSDPQRLSGLLQQLLQQQPFREGRIQAADGTVIDLTAPQAAGLALQLAQQNQLSQYDTDALMRAIYAYFGKLGR